LRAIARRYRKTPINIGRLPSAALVKHLETFVPKAKKLSMEERGENGRRYDLTPLSAFDIAWLRTGQRRYK